MCRLGEAPCSLTPALPIYKGQNRLDCFRVWAGPRTCGLETKGESANRICFWELYTQDSGGQAASWAAGSRGPSRHNSDADHPGVSADPPARSALPVRPPSTQMPDKVGGLQAPRTSHQLAINSGVPPTPFRFNSLERLTEFGRALHLRILLKQKDMN